MSEIQLDIWEENSVKDFPSHYFYSVCNISGGIIAQQSLSALGYHINTYIKYINIYVYTYLILCICIKAFGTPSHIVLLTTAG